jgi:hypothetical protein
LTTFEIGNPVLQCALAAVLALCGGSQEVPVVSTTGNGEFRAKINTQTNEIEYEFSYADMQAQASVLQAHIHLGQHSVIGGIMVWLCQTAANPAPAAVAAFTPMCSGPEIGTWPTRRRCVAVCAHPREST